MILTTKQLAGILLLPPESSRFQYLSGLNAALEEFEINTVHRAAAFIAQVAHETGGFRWFTELWGPTTQQLKYEPPSKLADQLGNTEKGDGMKFKGRGAIQLTGRANYKRFGEKLGIDLISHPELAATEEHAFRIAGLYWDTHGLNALADAGKFEAITRAINGGVNGLVDRRKYYDRGLEILEDSY